MFFALYFNVLKINNQLQCKSLTFNFSPLNRFPLKHFEQKTILYKNNILNQLTKIYLD